MLEYPIEEAAALLQKNLSAAQQSLQEVGEDLEFISDQCTIVEVGILQTNFILGLLIAGFRTKCYSSYEQQSAVVTLSLQQPGI